MRPQEQLNITDLLHLKWSLKKKHELDDVDDVLLANDRLYQKVSFLVEEEKTRLQIEDPKRWEEIHPLLNELDYLHKQQCNYIVERMKAVDEIIKINNEIFRDGGKAGKNHLK